ncbi:MAG: transglutaminase-like cysteine peptidase [Erythrobacter sp.]|nr:transglutaminase-like cysteine peptidase [Erythrobacter sp.]
MSALERMRIQQNQAANAVALAPPAVALEPLQPAASGARYCATATSAPGLATAPYSAEADASDDFLASKRVRIGKTNFDRDWRRVQSEKLSNRRHLADLDVAAASEEFVAAVNRWVNREVRYVEDRELYGQADYWAGARLTLMLGKGDCEDIALAKMQLLAAAGVPKSDMYLTIARDTVRRADHALLVVRLGDRYVVLDNATDMLLDGARSHDYNPVLSFSGDQAWLHGY